MSLNDEERQIIVQREFEKAERFYQQAVKNAEIEEWDVVANRTYYSIFHAVCALLIHDHHKIATHKGAVMVFGQNYVRTGIFTPEVGRFYSQLQTIREKADYNCDWSSSKDVTQPMMVQAREMLDTIKSLLADMI